MNDRAKLLVKNDPISRMLNVAIVGLSLGLVLLLVKVSHDLPGMWADTADWRVHHLPLLSTQQERTDVAWHDALVSWIDKIKQQRQQAYSK